MSRGDQHSYYLQVSKDFTKHRKKTNRVVGLSCRLSPTFLNAGTISDIFQQSGKQDSFRNILKSSDSMFESSGPEFFRTTTGIKSEPDAFDESRFVVTFLTILLSFETAKDFELHQKIF